MTQSFFRFLLCAGLLGAFLTASSARAQDPVAPPPEGAAAPPAEAPPPDAVPSSDQAAPVVVPAEALADESAADLAASNDASEGAADAAAESEAPKRVWRNSLFMFTPTISTNTFSPGAQLTYNPTFSLNFSFRPRYYLSDTLFLRIRQDLSVELTQSDSDSYTRQPLLTDTQLDLMRPGLIKASGLVVGAGVRLAFPVSIASRFANRILGTSLVANASYEIPAESLHLSVLFDFTYTHNWNSTNVPTHFGFANYVGEGPTICPGGADGCSTGGGTNVTEQFVFGPTLQWVPDGEKLNITATYYWWPRLAASLGEQTVVIGTGTVVLADTQTHWRSMQYFGLSVAYDFAAWLNLSLNYGTLTTQLSPNGNFRNPLWGPDTTLDVTAVVTLDQLYDAISGAGAELTPEQQRRIRNGEAAAPRRGATF